MLAGAGRHHNGLVAGMIGVGTLLLAAIWVVVALKEALNTIWDVAAPPSAGVWSLVKSYLVLWWACWRWDFCCWYPCW
jgi:membrane protein